MEEMVASQPGLIAPLLANPQVAELAQLVLDVDESGEPIVVTGCGTSEHGAQAVAELLDTALRQRGARGGRVEARQAFEAALDPRPGGLCLAVTESGGTRATLLALEAARDAGAATAAITANSQGAVIQMVNAVLLTPQRDLSWCHTVAYTSAILAGGAVAAEIAEVDLNADELTRWMTKAVRPGSDEVEIARALHGLQVLQIVGSGADRITARELALKIEEGARRPAVARDLETLLHGHLVACGPDTGLIAILTDRAAANDGCVGPCWRWKPRRGSGCQSRPSFLPRRKRCHSGCRSLQPAESSCQLERRPAATPCFAWRRRGVQRLTIAIAAEAGVNPDLIRREEAPYREAADLLETGSDW